MNLFIDTNVFLSFYHLSNDDLEEIHKLAALLEKGDVKLWLTEQVKDEFKRNRENKISEAVKKLQEQKKKPQFPQICKDYEEYPVIRELQKEYEKHLSSLIKKVSDDVASRSLKADEKITELFGKATIISTDSSLIEKARFRMDVRNPPGKDGSLGDAINWEGLLESVTNGEPLHLVADDKDYYSVLDENVIKEFLSDEWAEKKESQVHFYRRLSQFFKEHYPEIKLATELEKELAIKALVNSSNFASTHSSISKLSKYAEFNKSQANELAQVAISNSQINWIICDSDVYEFYSNLIESHGAHLENELLEQLKEELSDCEPSDDDA
ncbi:PIN domain-containing protein [Halopseudomonas phragmitis]|uniref:PIN domain-containing protein n=1 Tax=Halopseudomonas phragmitis TaxID=1931241 RepID=UPI0012BA78CA|nr:PIN domain-containing protein [Halopseudomonas phragmitis]